MLDGSAARQKALRRYSAGFTLKIDEPKVNDGKLLIEDHYEVVRDGTLLYADIRHIASAKGVAVPSESYMSWDGSRPIAYTINPSYPPVHRIGGAISASRGGPWWYGDWQGFVESAFWGYPGTQPEVALASGVDDWKYQGREGEAGMSVAKFTGRTRRLPDEQIEFWCSPDHDWAPIRVNLTSKFGYTRVSNVKLQQVRGHWLMASCVVATSNVNANSIGECRYAFAAQRLDLPAEIARSTFDLKFPIGCFFVDSPAGGMNVIAGVGVLVRNPDQSIRMEDIRKFPEYEALTDYARPERGLNAVDLDSALTYYRQVMPPGLHPPSTQPSESAARGTIGAPLAAATVPPTRLAWRWIGAVCIGLGVLVAAAAVMMRRGHAA